MIDHETIRAAMEVAATEPGGLERLEAGDTAEAALVVSHLIACPSCSAELARLHRTETLLRPLVAAAPSSDLRARTLAYVHEMGRDRSAASREPVPVQAPASLATAPAAVPPTPITPTPIALATEPAQRRRTWPAPAWLAAVAAALVVGVLGGALLGGNIGRPSGTGDPATALAAVTRDASLLLAAGDVRQVVLADASGVTRGSLLLSPSQGRMLAVAADLPQPGAGRVYRCWVATSTGRVTLGTMWQAGGVAWWSGSVTLPANLPYDVVYGVSLVDAASSGGSSDTILSGHLVSRGS